MVADEPETRHRAEHEDRTQDMERGLGAAAERHRLHELEPFDEDERPADAQQPADSDAAEPPHGDRDRAQDASRAAPHSTENRPRRKDGVSTEKIRWLLYH